LIKVADAVFRIAERRPTGTQVRVVFTHGEAKYDLVVTDPVAEQGVRVGRQSGKECMLLVSMAPPYGGYHFKLVAGVIEV
jgi:hypothetical protein